MNIRTYTDPSDFGCTYASTITEFYNSLPNDSIFMCDAYDLTDSSWNLPGTKYGTMIACKKSNDRMAFYFVGKGQNLGIQVKLLKTVDGIMSIEDIWHKVAYIDNVYPVGSIYISYTSTSPASLFGGSWEQIKDRFLLGVGSTYTSITKGGTAQHGHSIASGSADIMVKSNHLYYNESDMGFIGNYSHSGISAGTPGSYSISKGVSLQGSTSGASNMPPYQTVYMWRRTA